MVYRKRKMIRKKKRYFKKRRYNRRRKYDASIFRKMDVYGTLRRFNAAPHADVTFQWSNNAAGPASTLNITLFNSLEWAAMTNVYAEYRVVAAKFQLFPFASDQANVIKQYAEVGSDAVDLLGQGTSNNDFQALRDYKMYQGERVLKRFIRVRKYNQSRAQNWLNTSNSSGLSSSTLMRMYITDLGFDYDVAQAHAVYYVQFRGYKL